MEYHVWLIVLVLVIAVLLAIFALYSEFQAYSKVKRIVPAWQIDDIDAKIAQLESIAAYGGFHLNTWRVALIAAVISTALIWIVLAPYLTPLMILAIGTIIFIIGYFFSAFMVAHYYRPLAFKAKPGDLGNHEVLAQGKGVHKVGDDPLNLPPGYKLEPTPPVSFALPVPAYIPDPATPSVPEAIDICIPVATL